MKEESRLKAWRVAYFTAEIALLVFFLYIIGWIASGPLCPGVHTQGLNSSQIAKACGYSLMCTTC